MRSKQSLIITLIIAIMAVSTASIFIRNAQNEVPSLVIASFRLSIASLILGVFVLPSKRNEITRIIKSHYLPLMISGFLLALHFACWITSLEYTSVMSSVVLVTTTPIWVSIFSPIFLQEKMTWQISLGLIIALIGSFIIILSQNCLIIGGKFLCDISNSSLTRNAIAGNILAVLGAFAAAGYVMLGRKLRKNINLFPYIFLVYSVASIVLISFSLFSGYGFSGYSKEGYFWMILLAIVPQLIGHSVLNWLLGFLPAVYVAISLLGEPVGSSILAWFFLKESPTIIEIFGAILILVGILITTFIRQTKDDFSVNQS